MREFHVEFIGKPKIDSQYFSTSGRAKVTLPCMDTDWPDPGTILYVIEKEAADKLAAHLELAIAGLHGANVDVKFLINRLKDYKGEK